jgi:orotidine-5'-phosphate decarboxylase
MAPLRLPSRAVNADFAARLCDRIRGGAAPAVVGLDPRADALPADLSGATPAERCLAFYQKALPVLARHVPCVKPNIAFFEAWGSAGFRAYEQTCAIARELGLIVIGDVKRGDIGSTAEAYAEGHFRHADALTLHPWLGRDSVAPFLKYCQAGQGDRAGKGVFVLVRTSNPGARDFQDLPTGAHTVADAVAEAVHEWGRELGRPGGWSPVGAVVGATWPEQLRALRGRMPRAWILLPGVGAQGAKAADTAAAFDGEGLGGLINQSRGVMGVFRPEESGWLARIEAAALKFADECRAVAPGPGRP